MDKSYWEIIDQVDGLDSRQNMAIHERSLATELMESKNEGDPFALYDFLPRSFRGKNMVLTHHLIYILRCVVLFIIALIYASYDGIHWLVTGKSKSKRLDKEVLARRVPDKKWIKRLHPEKWRGIQSITGLNTFIFVFVLLAAIVLFVFSLNFVIKEVVLPDNNSRISDYGVVTFDQGCYEEQHIFLLNAATLWENTGISVSKGDKVYITASGSMYSDVDEMVEAADKNKKLLYPRSSVNINHDVMDPGAQYCIYGRYEKDSSHAKNKPAFGSLLYQICDEVSLPCTHNNDTFPDAVNQINFTVNQGKIFKDNRYNFKADKSGILHFCYNDILLDKQLIDAIAENESEDSQLYKDLTKIYENCTKAGKDKKMYSKSDTVAWLKNNVDPQIWYADNIGESLINIRVEKNVWKLHIPYHKKLLVSAYRTINPIYTPTGKNFLDNIVKSSILVVPLILILWVLIDAMASRFMFRL